MTPPPRNVYRSGTLLLSSLMVVIGAVLLVRTLAEGGGPLSIGVIMGVLFLAAGVGRVLLARRQGS